MYKSKELLNVVGILATVILLLPAVTQADGLFVAPIGSFMYEPTQQAFIDYDGETGIEQLTILPGFTGDAKSFAWIVPVPALPEVDLADGQMFRALDNLTRPVHRSRDGDWDCIFNSDTSHDIYAGDGDIDIISSGMVGYYQTLVLSADEAPSLLAFLTGLGFLHEENVEAVTGAITEYVEQSWYFVAMQVDSTALAETFPSDHYYGHYSGGLNPIKLTFPSDEMIYPMKISALSAAQNSKVHLYVKTDHRVNFPGASTLYANRFSAEEINELPRFESFIHDLQPGDFLTKLQRGYRPAEMTEDVILVPAPVNDEFLMIIYSGLPLTGLLIFSVPVGIAFKRRFWLGPSKG